MEQPNAAVLCHAIVTFLVGGVIRRLQQASTVQRQEKYSFLFHTEQKRESHTWQEKVVTEIISQLKVSAQKCAPIFDALVDAAYVDIRRSLDSAGAGVPEVSEVRSGVTKALLNGEVMITKVNSDNEVEVLLDDFGELKLRTPFNLFIGGQILDRGITIRNLIAFYYGRNPQKFQQDTMLQHSRMYGARPLDDLPVTRFYAPLHIYNIMRRIHEFDAALREAFENGAHDQGVYFIRRDAADRLIPCSPNKLLFSRLTTIRPGRRLLPIGFQTVAKSNGRKAMERLDTMIDIVCGKTDGVPVLVDVEQVLKILSLCYENIEFQDEEDDERRAHIAILEHLAKETHDTAERGKVWVIAYRDRDIARYREAGRFSDAPDTKKETEAGRAKAVNVPSVLLFRQNGNQVQGWRDLPFWWPVIITPDNAVPSVFAAESPAQA